MLLSSRKSLTSKLLSTVLSSALVFSGVPAAALAEGYDEAANDEVLVESPQNVEEEGPTSDLAGQDELLPPIDSEEPSASTDTADDAVVSDEAGADETSDEMVGDEDVLTTAPVDDSENDGSEGIPEEADAFALAYQEDGGEATIVGYVPLATDDGDVHVIDDGSGPLTAGDESYTIDEPMSFEPRLVIPSKVGGLTVTAIGDSAFEDASWLEEVTLPETVRSVGMSAFRGCSALRGASLPKGLKTVAAYAFRDCASLESAELPEGVGWLEESDWSDGSEEVGGRWLSCQGLFWGCSSLRSARVPASMGHVGGYMFSGCSSLASVAMAEGVSSVGYDAFGGCRSLGSVALPSTLRSIGGSAFAGCDSLSSVSIPEGVESLGREAFANCSGLSSLSLPSTLSEIGERSLSRCNSFKTGPDGALHCNSVPLEVLCSTWAQYWAARSERYACQLHTTAVAPEGVAPGELELVWADNGDGTCTLVSCKTKAAHITLPSTINGLKVTAIGESAFKGDNVLQTVVLPDTVTTVQKDAFSECSSLENVFVPNSVTSIDDTAFKSSESVVLTCKSSSYAQEYASARSIPTTQVVSLTLALVSCPESAPYAKGGAKPAVKVTIGDTVLKKDKHYTVAYSDNTKPGCALVTVTAIDGSGYEGSQYATFMVEGATQQMHRLYNPNSGEHFYTAATKERDALVKLGWKYEGVGWIAPIESKTPVHRLYNRFAGDHHYTTNDKEKDALVKAGWTYEGIGWYSDEAKGTPLYRQYNPNAVTGSHNYTTNKKENDALVTMGWKAEGVGWYGVKE